MATVEVTEEVAAVLARARAVQMVITDNVAVKVQKEIRARWDHREPQDVWVLRGFRAHQVFLAQWDQEDLPVT